jgi:hypothetical protein
LRLCCTLLVIILLSLDLQVLTKSVKEHTQVLIKCRNNRTLLCYVKAFDRHMNMVSRLAMDGFHFLHHRSSLLASRSATQTPGSRALLTPSTRCVCDEKRELTRCLKPQLCGKHTPIVTPDAQATFALFFLPPSLTPSLRDCPPNALSLCT